MEQIEFKDYECVADETCPLAKLYEIDKENSFYIEPNFYAQIKYLKERFPEKFDALMGELKANVMRNHRVIFTADFESPVVYKENYIYQEIEDLTNKLNIFSGYISRGSDYGD